MRTFPRAAPGRIMGSILILAASWLWAAAAWTCASAGGSRILQSAETIPHVDAATSASVEGDGLPQASARTCAIYGEFQDARLFRSKAVRNPRMSGWTAREIFDGATGATIQAKTYGRAVPDRIILVDGEEAAYADGFGHFWLELEPGEHQIEGRCAGFEEARISLLLEAGSSVHLAFLLEPR